MLILNSQELFQLYLTGKEDAASAIFSKYVARLITLARSRIASKLQPRFDADDVVQSAFRSFFIHARNDEYELAHSGDLWRLLASITLHKLYRQVEFQTAGKRSVDREEFVDLSASQATAPEPSVAEAVALAEELQLVIHDLTADEQQVFMATLQGQSIDEVAGIIDKSKRTVRRLLADIKYKIERRLMSDDRATKESQRSIAPPHAPLRYSDYVLEQMLGSGGMGKVFRAREKHTDRKVAIKALHKSRQHDARAVALFVQEAKILSTLRHPNIVGVQGLGQFPSGGYFIVMDFVDGADLQVRQRQGALPWTDAVRIVKDIAGAIQYAHEQGVVHCDLKPGNILIDKDQRIYVTDFGFAFLQANSSETVRTNVGGTAGYIAPEIILRQSSPTPAADIYALGMLLWTLMTGKTPDKFNLNDAASDARESVYRVCRRCLSPDPLARYPSAKDLALDLDRLTRLHALKMP